MFTLPAAAPLDIVSEPLIYILGVVPVTVLAITVAPEEAILVPVITVAPSNPFASAMKLVEPAGMVIATLTPPELAVVEQNNTASKVYVLPPLAEKTSPVILARAVVTEEKS